MRSPLSPVIDNFYMEHFEKNTLEAPGHKPSVGYRYVDDTFVVWKHRNNNFYLFLEHLNKQHLSVQFTIETEGNGRPSFDEVSLINQLVHAVYNTATHAPPARGSSSRRSLPSQWV